MQPGGNFSYFDNKLLTIIYHVANLISLVYKLFFGSVAANLRKAIAKQCQKVFSLAQLLLEFIQHSAMF
jgi:hypothetical protein